MYRRARGLLFKLSPEQAHKVAEWGARAVQRVAPGIISSRYAFSDTALHQTLWGLAFRNPVGLAAGFDKNATMPAFWASVGMGFVEVGSVTARAVEGNPKPRAFRLPADEALINRMGLNNDGAERVARRLTACRETVDIPIGVNIAKTPDDRILGDAARADFRESYRHLAPLADFVVLNISCPNTEDGKTFEEPEALDALLTALADERKGEGDRPLLVKFAPPVTTRIAFDSRIEELLSVSDDHDIAGVIATNTASDRAGLNTAADELKRIGRGGLSGVPLQERSTALVRYIYRTTDGSVPIIGVGGINSAEAALEKIEAGASLVELYTGLVYHGPALVHEIKKGLVRLMDERGYGTLHEAIGARA